MRCLASACGPRRKYVFLVRFDSIGLAIRASRAIVLGLLPVVRRRRFGDFPVVNADGLTTLGHHAQEEHGTLRHNLPSRAPLQ